MTYFLLNGLMINSSKTQCIFIGSRQLCSRIAEDVVVQFDGTSISPSTHVKNLGLYMDRYLTFETHISEISKKVMGMLIYVNRIGSYLDKTTRITIIQSLVMSHIKYCLSIWGTTNSALINKIQKLQNFAARVAVGGLKKIYKNTRTQEQRSLQEVKRPTLVSPCTLTPPITIYPPHP